MGDGIVKRAVLAEMVRLQHGVCALCDALFREEDPATIDHIKPLSVGGGDHRKNLQAAHWTCNNQRGSMPIEMWRELRKISGPTEPIAAPSSVVDAPKRKSEEAQLRLGSAMMAARIEFLERANAALHRDWQAAIDKLRAIEQIVGGAALGRGGVVEAIKKKMEA